MRIYIIFVTFILMAAFTFSQNIEDINFGTDTSLDIVTWNIEWFPKNGQTTIDLVGQIIHELDADVFALQEINDTNAFKQIIQNLDGYQGFIKSSWYAGLAYIYNSNTVNIQHIYEIYTTQPYWYIFPRSPVVMELSFMGNDYVVINNHLKCCGDGILNVNDSGDEENRRFQAAKLLKIYVDSAFADKNVFVVGDMNDILTDSYANNIFRQFLDDSLNYQFADMEIAQGSNLNWSYPTWPSHLDHILITNDLFDDITRTGSEIKTLKLENYFAEGWDAYEEDISDHRPVAIKIVLEQSQKAKELMISTQSIKLYPNPAFNLINIEVAKNMDKIQAFIYNNFGHLVKTEIIEASQSNNTINLGTLNDGIYYIKFLINDNQERTQSFIIIHN